MYVDVCPCRSVYWRDPLHVRSSDQDVHVVTTLSSLLILFYRGKTWIHKHAQYRYGKKCHIFFSNILCKSGIKHSLYTYLTSGFTVSKSLFYYIFIFGRDIRTAVIKLYRGTIVLYQNQFLL